MFRREIAFVIKRVIGGGAWGYILRTLFILGTRTSAFFILGFCCLRNHSELCTEIYKIHDSYQAAAPLPVFNATLAKKTTQPDRQCSLSLCANDSVFK
jgi:hypothetical protein